MTHLNSKVGRQGAIAQILAAKSIASQTELASELAKRNIVTTQATLSRDLEELSAMKVRNNDGISVYALPLEGAPGQLASRRMEDAASKSILARWCPELLVSVECANNLLVLRTPAGGAQLLSSAIDMAQLAEIVGSVGGDDTIVIVCRSNSGAGRLRTYLLGLSGAAGK